MSRRKKVVRNWHWRVRELIEEKGLSINELARRAGVSRSTVQAFCTDPQHGTTATMWARLAKALGVSLAEMLQQADEEHTGKRE